MDYLLVIDNATGDSRIMPLAEAAVLTGIEPEDIQLAIQALGACQSMDFIILDTETADDVLAA